MYDETVTCND